jgi:hypothetical protein
MHIHGAWVSFRDLAGSGEAGERRRKKRKEWWSRVEGRLDATRGKPDTG